VEYRSIVPSLYWILSMQSSADSISALSESESWNLDFFEKYAMHPRTTKALVLCALGMSYLLTYPPCHFDVGLSILFSHNWLTVSSLSGINFESSVEKSFPVVGSGHIKPNEGSIAIPAMEVALDFRNDLLLMGMVLIFAV